MSEVEIDRLVQLRPGDVLFLRADGATLEFVRRRAAALEEELSSRGVRVVALNYSEELLVPGPAEPAAPREYIKLHSRHDRGFFVYYVPTDRLPQMFPDQTGGGTVLRCAGFANGCELSVKESVEEILALLGAKVRS